MKTSLLALVATTISLLAQGPLAPTAAPAPSMKTLAEIEARTPIPASPAAPIAGPHFTITQPGSYYLTGNITVTTGDGIRITAASDVSIDLNGFTINSTLTGSANGYAIRCASAHARLSVKNGSLVSSSVPPSVLQGFQHGILSSGNLSEVYISGVHICGMASTGIFLDTNGIVENCTATSNGGDGIVAPRGSISHRHSEKNRFSGITATEGTVSHCTATNNGNEGISAAGGSVSHCRAKNSFREGIRVDLGVAAHCVATGNSTDPSNSHKEIQASAAGQRDACVPATE